ncbi:MAG: hypothetical protein AAF539_14535 [Planctomycetota bacterium]
MPKVTILFGLILIAIGVLGFVGSGSQASDDVDTTAEVASDESTAATPARSVTALIPAFVGVALAICGLIALKESLVKHAMHAAAMIGVLGTLAGAGRGGMGLGKFFSGDPSLNQRSFLFVWLMALVCGVFVVLCVKSFIDVRRQRQAEQSS